MAIADVFLLFQNIVVTIISIWQTSINRGKSYRIEAFVIDGAQANISFIDRGLVSVKARCTECDNDNTFNHNL